MVDLHDELQSAFAGRYEIERELGHGGMAVVYLARDAKNNRKVALKVLRPHLADSLAADRFLQEIAIAAPLVHPNIVPVHDSGDASGFLYYTMPFVEGPTLRERLDRDVQLPIEDALSITRQVASALDYAHARGAVHRDVKPDNILLQGDHVLVADFGLARAVTMATSKPLTDHGIVVGTPPYMSPEQCTPGAKANPPTDIYSLGCVVFEMIAGVPPFRAATVDVMMAHHRTSDPPVLSQERRSCPAALDAVIRKALAKSPADRFRTAGEFFRALDAAASGSGATQAGWNSATGLGEPDQSDSASRSQKSGRRSGKTRRVAFAALGLVIAGGLAALARSNLGRPSSEASRLDPRRIAVLEFEDQSADGSLGHFASGLTAGLIQELSGSPAIKVLSRNSVRAFQTRGLPLDSVVSALNAGSVVEGSVRRSNDRLRVSVQLIDGATKTQLESATLERPLGELFALEDDLAHQVARFLRRRIGVEVRWQQTAAGTTDLRARELVFRAQKIREELRGEASGDTLAVKSAIARLRTADSLLAVAEASDPVWLQPTIERGWVALDLAARQAGPPRAAAFTAASDHAARALGRQPGHALALELQGNAFYWQAARLGLEDREFQDRLSRAEASLQKAVERDSSLATAWGTLSLVHVARGDVDKAQTEARAALAMDAYLEDAPRILLALYAANLMKGTFPEAWQWCERGGRDFPRDSRFIECNLTLLAEDDTRPPDPTTAWQLVAKAAEIDPPAYAKATGRSFIPIYREMMAAIVSARAGAVDTARAVAARVRAQVSREPELEIDLAYQEAFLHLVLGERSEAIKILGEYVNERPSMRGLIARHPRWRPLSSDSAFARLLSPR